MEQQEKGPSLRVGIAIDLSEAALTSESVELSPSSNTAVVEERQPKVSPHKCKQNSGGHPSPVIDLDSYRTLNDSSSDPEDEMPLFARLKKNKVARHLWQPTSSNFSTETSGPTEQKPKLSAVATRADVCILDSPPKKKKVSCQEFLETDNGRGSMEKPIVID